MTNLTAKFSVEYISLCELLLAAWCGIYCASLTKNPFVKPMAFVFVLSLMGVCIASGYGMICRKRWAWFASMLLGIAIAGVGGFFIWASSRGTDAYSRSEGGFAYGVGIFVLVPSVLGLVALCLPQTRQFLLTTRREWNEQGKYGDSEPKSAQNDKR